MKKEHREILNKIEEYLEQPGVEELRFFQALFNINLIKFEDIPYISNGVYQIKDDYNISDDALLKRMK